MSRFSRRDVLRAAGALGAAGLGWGWPGLAPARSAAAPAGWPSRPIELVVGYAAGGGTDVVMRAFAGAIGRHLRASVVVSNQPGAVASIATETVWRRPADGYTWLGTSSYNKFLRVQGLHRSSPYMDWQFFQVATSVQAWGVRANSPIRDFPHLLEVARSRTLRVSNSGVGGLWHEGTLLLTLATGVRFTHVPYEGGAPAALAALRGEVDVAATGLHEQIEHVRAGTMRCLAVFTAAPLEVEGAGVLRPVTEFVPALAGFAPFGAQYTIGVRRETPPEILQRMREAVEAAAQDAEVREQLRRMLLFPALAFGEEADRLAARLESATAWLFWEAKLPSARVNPEELGIPRPENFDQFWPPKGYRPAM